MILSSSPKGDIWTKIAFDQTWFWIKQIQYCKEILRFDHRLVMSVLEIDYYYLRQESYALTHICLFVCWKEYSKSFESNLTKHGVGWDMAKGGTYKILVRNWIQGQIQLFINTGR